MKVTNFKRKGTLELRDLLAWVPISAFIGFGRCKKIRSQSISNAYEFSQVEISLNKMRKEPSNCFCLWPSAKDQGITQVVVSVVLFNLSHFLFKRNLSEKILPHCESNQGPWASQQSILSTELKQNCYIFSWKIINLS